MEKIKENLGVLFSCLVLAAVFIPLFYLSFFNHPVCWDDYFTFSGLLSEKHSFYYGQRFSSQLNLTLFYPDFKNFNFQTMCKILTIYHVTSIVYVILFSLAFFYLLHEVNLFVLKLPKKTFFCFFSFLIYLLINFINASPELFYCHTITTGYTGGLIFMFLFLGLIVRLYGIENKHDRILCIVLLFIITFILAGYIEFFVLFSGYISFYLFLFKKNKNTSKRDTVLLLLFIFSVLIFCSFFVVSFLLTKGTIEAKYEAEGDTLLKRLPYWCYTTAVFVFQDLIKLFSFQNFPFILLVCVLVEKKTNFTLNFKQCVFFVFLYPVILLMSFSGCYGGLNWFSLYSYPRNVFDVIFFFISMPIMYFLYGILKHVVINLYLDFYNKKYVYIRCAGFLIVFFSLVFSCFISNKYVVGKLWKDIRTGVAATYNNIQLENYKILCEAEKGTSVNLVYPGRPESIVTSQGNYILSNDIDGGYLAHWPVKKFWKLEDIFYK